MGCGTSRTPTPARAPEWLIIIEEGFLFFLHFSYGVSENINLRSYSTAYALPYALKCPSPTRFWKKHALLSRQAGLTQKPFAVVRTKVGKGVRLSNKVAAQERELFFCRPPLTSWGSGCGFSQVP